MRFVGSPATALALLLVAGACPVHGCDDAEGPADDDAADDDTGSDDDSSADDDDSAASADPWLDLVFSCSYDGVGGDVESYVYHGGSGHYDAAARTGLPTWNSSWNTVADLDADGWLDVVFANHHAHEEHATGSYIYWGGPDGLSVDDRSALETVGAKQVTAVDLDRDGHLDLVFGNRMDDESYLVDSYVYWGSAAGYSEHDRTDLPTIGAVGVSVAGD